MYTHTAGLWSLVTLNRGVASVDPTHSPLAKDSLLLLLVLTHQQAGGHNPYRTALGSFSDERGDKGTSSFSVSLEKVYVTMCRCVCVCVCVCMCMEVDARARVCVCMGVDVGGSQSCL